MSTRAAVTALSTPSRSSGGVIPWPKGRGTPRRPATTAATATAASVWAALRVALAIPAVTSGNEREQADGGENRPGEEGEPPARLSPRESQPAEGEDAVEDRQPEGVVAERQHRRGERKRQTGTRSPERGDRGRRRERSRPTGRIERQRRPAGERPRRRRPRPGRPAGRNPVSRRRRPSASGCRLQAPTGARSREQPRAAVVDGSCASACEIALRSRFGRSGRSGCSGGQPASIVLAICGSGTPQNGCLPASASQSRTPTAQMSLAEQASSPRRRSGEM